MGVLRQAKLFAALFGTMAVLTSSMLMLGATDMWGPQALQACGGAAPCLHITSGPMEKLVVEHIDFEQDTVGDVVRRIPSWFGSQARPLGLTVHNLLLKEDVPLRAQGISSMAHISLVSMKEMRISKDAPSGIHIDFTAAAH